MKMVKVTDVDKPMFININQIEAIYSSSEGSLITTINNSEYACTETPEEVYQKIKETEKND